MEKKSSKNRNADDHSCHLSIEKSLINEKRVISLIHDTLIKMRRSVFFFRV